MELFIGGVLAFLVEVLVLGLLFAHKRIARAARARLRRAGQRLRGLRPQGTPTGVGPAAAR